MELRVGRRREVVRTAAEEPRPTPLLFPPLTPELVALSIGVLVGV